MTGPRHRRRSHARPDWPDRALSVLLGAAVIVLLATATGALGGMRLVLIKSGSMSPALLTGDIALSRSTLSGQIGPGDIATFRHPALRTAVTHRVVSTHTADGRVDVTTKGDANQIAEDWQVPATGRVGRVMFRIPGAGALIRAVSPRPAAATLVAAGGGCLGLLLLRPIWRTPARPLQHRWLPRHLPLGHRRKLQPFGPAESSPALPACRPSGLLPQERGTVHSQGLEPVHRPRPTVDVATADPSCCATASGQQG